MGLAAAQSRLSGSQADPSACHDGAPPVTTAPRSVGLWRRRHLDGSMRTACTTAGMDEVLSLTRICGWGLIINSCRRCDQHQADKGQN